MPATPETHPASAADRVTILTTYDGRPAAKTFRLEPDGSIKKLEYGAGKYFSIEEQPVDNIYDLSKVLVTLEGRPDAFVIRGEPVHGADRRRCLRRLRGEGATFRAAPRQYLMIDVDRLRCPDGLKWVENREAAVRYVISLLPPQFSDVTVHWQLSNSAGVATDGNIKVHLWFWLSQRCSDEALRSWAAAWNNRCGFKLIDVALFNPVQIHYTAAPQFIGMPDPVPRRSGLILGNSDAVDLGLLAGPTVVGHGELQDIPDPVCPKTGRKQDGRNRGGLRIRFETYLRLRSNCGAVDLERFATESWEEFCRE